MLAGESSKMILSVRAGNELKYLQMHHRVPSSESFWPLCTWVSLWCLEVSFSLGTGLMLQLCSGYERRVLLTGSAIPIPTPMSRLLILMLGEILRTIQSGIVGDAGHRLQSVILGLSFGVINCFRGSLCCQAAFFQR